MFEYRTTEIQGRADGVMAELGADGWELVSAVGCVLDDDGANRKGFTLFWKRKMVREVEQSPAAGAACAAGLAKHKRQGAQRATGVDVDGRLRLPFPEPYRRAAVKPSSP